jgi:hypothetical protein
MPGVGAASYLWAPCSSTRSERGLWHIGTYSCRSRRAQMLHRALAVYLVVTKAAAQPNGQGIARCGDIDGSGNYTTVSNAGCGNGYVYNVASFNSTCVGPVCNAAAAADKATCCIRESPAVQPADAFMPSKAPEHQLLARVSSRAAVMPRRRCNQGVDLSGVGFFDWQQSDKPNLV